MLCSVSTTLSVLLLPIVAQIKTNYLLPHGLELSTGDVKQIKD